MNDESIVPNSIEQPGDTPEPEVPTFIPVKLRPRYDGWTANRQIAFIEALAETACVHEACRRVGISDVAAYALRRRDDAQAFRDAWDAALDYAMHRLEQAALSRALNGVPRPIFFRGEKVGEWREYDERLTMFLLRYRRSARYGAWLDRQPPGPTPDEDETAGRLSWHLDEIVEFTPAQEDAGPVAHADEE